MANYTSVIASNICDAAGNKLASGTVSFQATDAANQPLNFQVGGGGQVVTTPATAAITAGAIAGGFQVADSANTSPAGILYRITITDTTLNRVVVTYSLVTVTGTTFNLDNYSQTGAAVLPPAGGSVNGPLTVAGNLSVTGSSALVDVTAKSVNGTQYANQFPGADIGAKINAAIAFLGSQGGKVVVPAGTYSFSTTIVKPRFIHIEGDSSNGTTLVYTGSGVAIVVGDNTGSQTAYPPDGLENITLTGPGTVGSSIGVYLGGDPAAVISPANYFADHQRFVRCRIAGFATGVQLGNNAFLDSFVMTVFNGNGTNISVPTGLANTGENIDFVNCTIANATVTGANIALSNTSLELFGCSIDADAAPGFTISAGLAYFYGCHFEAQSGTFLSQSGSSVVAIYGGDALHDATTGTDAQMFLITGSSSPTFLMIGTKLSAGTGHTVTQAINYTATGGAKLLFVEALPNYNANGAFTALVNAQSQFQGLYINDGQGNMQTGAFWNMMNGAKVTVSGSGGAANTLQIFDSVGGQSKYIRVASNVLQIINNAFTNDIVDITDTGLVTAKGGLDAGSNGVAHAGPISGASTLAMSSLITTYNNQTTAGMGVSTILGATLQKAESAADTNVLTVTPAAVAGSYRLHFVLSLSAANAATLGWTATWKDSNGAAQTPTNLALSQTGVAAPALTFTTSVAGNYYGHVDIDTDASATPIVFKLTFAGTSFTGKASATVERLS